MAFQTPLDVINDFQALIDLLREQESIDGEQFLDRHEELEELAEADDMTGYTLVLCRDGWHFYSPQEVAWEREQQAETANVLMTATDALADVGVVVTGGA